MGKGWDELIEREKTFKEKSKIGIKVSLCMSFLVWFRFNNALSLNLTHECIF